MSGASADGVHAVNQRDLGTVLPHLIQQGIFFRASMQHEFSATATATGTIIDLRRPPKPTAASPPPPPPRSGARNTINVNMVPTGTGLRLVAKLPFSKSLPVCMVPVPEYARASMLKASECYGVCPGKIMVPCDFCAVQLWRTGVSEMDQPSRL